MRSGFIIPVLMAMLAASLLTPRLAWACTVPVFRYALERWPADRFSAVIFTSGKLTEAQEEVLAALYRAADVQTAFINLQIEKMDVSGGVAEKYQDLWRQHKSQKLPFAVIHYPGEERRVMWTGPLESPEIKSLLNSPARAELGKRLLAGDAVVFVLLESGSSVRDQRAAKLIAEQIPILEKSVKVSQVLEDDPLVEGPTLKSNLPLKLKLSLLRISRDDPKEKMFVQMLLHSQETQLPADMPVAFPIFGRGRVLCAFGGMEIRAENLEDAAKFLAGPCSCQVKELNPGIDLLMAADWDSILEGRDAVAPRVARVEIP